MRPHYLFFFKKKTMSEGVEAKSEAEAKVVFDNTVLQELLMEATLTNKLIARSMSDQIQAEKRVLMMVMQMTKVFAQMAPPGSQPPGFESMVSMMESGLLAEQLNTEKKEESLKTLIDEHVEVMRERLLNPNVHADKKRKTSSNANVHVNTKRKTRSTDDWDE
jgi:tellurite resistance protein